MRKHILALLLLLLATPAFGLLGIVTGGVEIDSNSKHVYRGVELEDKFVIQPKAYVAFMGLKAKMFNNYTLDPDGDREKLNRTDLMFSYSIIDTVGLDIASGVKYYHFYDEGAKDTTELFLNIDYSVMGLVGVYSHHYIDVQEDVGKYYGNVGAKFMIDFIPVIGAEGYMDLNWQKPYYGDNVDFVFPYSLNISAAVKFKPIPLFYIKAHVDMTILLDGDTKDMNDNLDKDNNIMYFGLATGLSF